MKNRMTPNLNGAGDGGMFIRGGQESEAGTFQEDAAVLEDHFHEAENHSHEVKRR